MSNRHLNLFETYTERNSDNPIENNLSRGYAILLKEYPELLYMLIDKINEKNNYSSEDFLGFPYEEYEVDFQKPAKQIEDVNEIIAVALTTEDLSKEFLKSDSTIEELIEKQGENNNSNTNDKADNYSPITDITIKFNNSKNERTIMIIIEVKRTNENCVNQLCQQIICAVENNILKSKDNASEKVTSEELKEYISKYCNIRVSIVWAEVLEMIDNYNNMKPQEEFIVSQYYDYVSIKHPNWLKVKNLSELSIFDEERINKRIVNILDSIKTDANGEETEYYFDKSDSSIAVPDKFCDFLERLEVGFEDKYLYLRIWPSNTKSQFYSFIAKSPNLDFFKKGDKKFDEKYDIEVKPFIKFSNSFGRYQFELSFKNDEIDSVLNFMKNHTGKYKKENLYAEFLCGLKENLDKYEIDKLNRSFDENVKKTGMSVFNTCLSFQITVKIPFEDAQSLDKDNSLRDYIIKVANELPNKIVTKAN